MNAIKPTARPRPTKQNKPSSKSCEQIKEAIEEEDPLGETRDQRQQLTKLALAQVVRERMVARRLRQSEVVRLSGISRTFLRSILRAEKGSALFVFLQLSHGLGADPCELLREVLCRRDCLRGSAISK